MRVLLAGAAAAGRRPGLHGPDRRGLRRRHRAGGGCRPCCSVRATAGSRPPRTGRTSWAPSTTRSSPACTGPGCTRTCRPGVATVKPQAWGAIAGRPGPRWPASRSAWLARKRHQIAAAAPAARRPSCPTARPSSASACRPRAVLGHRRRRRRAVRARRSSRAGGKPGAHRGARARLRARPAHLALPAPRRWPSSPTRRSGRCSTTSAATAAPSARPGDLHDRPARPRPRPR